MSTVAVAIICKTPIAGKSKTRLSPPLRPTDCAEISSCFIRDLSATIELLTREGDASGHAVYTPFGSETLLRQFLPPGFGLTPQSDGDFGHRLARGIEDLLRTGHSGAILINSDSPTLPLSILRSAVKAVTAGDNNVVLSPAFDGGYTLIGLSKPHPRLFENIPWSTEAVYELTRERANELGLSVVEMPGWYDIDDEGSLRMLEDEFAGRRHAFLTTPGAEAPATRRFLHQRRMAARELV